MTAMALVLASKSPRRRELMALVAPSFELDEAALDEGALCAESARRAEMPAQLAQALAAAKAGAVFAARGGRDTVVDCDTVVELDGAVLGKPADEEQARMMLESLSGREHRVHTGVCVLAPGRPPARFTETTRVTFAGIPQEEIDAVVRTEEPYDKAGGYGIQGWAARFVPSICGCYYNVMGLPVPALYRALAGL